MYKIIKTEEIFKHPRLTLLEDDIEYEDGTPSKYLKFAHKSNASQTIGIRDDGKICMVEEYSHAVEVNILNFPGGLIPLDGDPKEGAKREFMEEAGHEITELQKIGMIYPYHRRLPEELYLFVGKAGKSIEVERDDSEQTMHVIWLTEEEIEEKVLRGEITNSHALAHWAIYKAWKNEAK